MISAEGARNHGLLNVPTEEFFDTKHYLPENTDEQRKIANFLIALERRIEVQQSLVDNLKKYKRGVVSSILTHQIKFADSEGKPYPEWTSCTLQDAVVFLDGQRYEAFKWLGIPYCNPNEQEKIDELFSTLSRRIEKQSALVNSLKKYKRGLLMHYFSDDRTQQWTHYSISQIGKVITGSTPPTNDRSNYDGNLLFCSPGDVGEEKYISSTEKRVSPKGFALGRPLPPNSVIVTCIGLIGKLGIATTGMITNQQINALVVSEGFDHEFIYYAFENFFPEYRSKVSMQTLPILSKSEFEKLIIKAPILDVQLKISSHLASMDKRIEHTQKELKLLFEQRRGIIQQLFI